MRKAHTGQTPSGADTPADEFDAWLEDFVTASADDALDRQLFAIREALADFRSL